ncbi:MAG TPA: hypothetical protein VFN44_07890 [Solirubrobacteraceae bacterium]|nr:hypothetical protein [Solirubrobacteraceae bacterium]
MKEIFDAIDALDDMLFDARLLLTSQARVDREQLRAAVGRIRSSHDRQFAAQAAGDPRIVATTRALTELEAIAADAPGIPLTSQVRVNVDAAIDKLDRLREALPEAVRLTGDASEHSPRESGELLLAIDAFDDALHRARPVPLTNQVRLENADLDAHLERLRAALRASATDRSATAALDVIAATVAEARPVPLTDQVRVAKPPIQRRLGELRALVQPLSR